MFFQSLVVKQRQRTSTTVGPFLFVCAIALTAMALNSCGSPRIGGLHLAYVTLAAADRVAGYTVDSSGKLSSIPGSPFSGGSSPSAVCIHSSRKFVYVANETGGDISLFMINSSDGALTEGSSRTTAGSSPSSLATDA